MSGIDVRRAVCLAVVVGASAWFAACDDNGSPTAPTSAATASHATLTITGKTSVDHPGETTQLRAVFTARDGTTRDVTAQAQWTPKNDVLATVAPGLFRTVHYGSGGVVATYKAESTFQASTTVRVAPDGSFVVAGMVVTYARTPLSGATVEATSGVGTVSTVASEAGKFWIVALGDAILRVEKGGFPTYTKAVNMTADTVMDLIVPRAGAGSATGSYTLTFTASRSCSTLATTPWVYQVDMEEWQQTLMVYAHGQQFVSWAAAPGFTGTRIGDSVTFQITDDIMNARFCLIDGNLAYSGVATGTISERGIVATFDGRIGTCQAADHRMELVRMQTPLH